MLGQRSFRTMGEKLTFSLVVVTMMMVKKRPSLVLLQGVPTSLEYAKYNVLKLREVCERSELRLQNIDPIKRGEF